MIAFLHVTIFEFEVIWFSANNHVDFVFFTFSSSPISSPFSAVIVVSNVCSLPFKSTIRVVSYAFWRLLKFWPPMRILYSFSMSWNIISLYKLNISSHGTILDKHKSTKVQKSLKCYPKNTKIVFLWADGELINTYIL